MDVHRANLSFQFISHLYAQTAVVVTGNVPFVGSGRIFGGDDIIASTILDRLLRSSHKFLIVGSIYRMKGEFPAANHGGGQLS